MMRKLFLFFTFAFMSLLTSAQPVSVEEKHFPSTVSFATPFEAEILFSHAPETTLILSTQTPSKDFEITAQKTETVSPGNTSLQLTLMPFALDKSTFTVVMDVLQGNAEASTYTVEIPLTVSSVKLFKDKNFHEIRDPKVPVSWLMWLFILALIIVILWAIRRLRKETELEGPSWQRFGPDVDNRPCHEIALSKIDALINSGLWENQEYKLFYISLFDILREYLFRRFHMDVSAETSAELLRNAKKEKELFPVLQDLKDFLTSGDLVKFAKVVPTETERNRDITYLQTLIKKTIPLPPAEQKEEQP